MPALTVHPLTQESFVPFGSIGLPQADGFDGPADVPLDLTQGVPRFYLMRLPRRGLSFEMLARHDRVTQCLASADGTPWLIAVAPARSRAPTIDDIRAFRIPGQCFIMLARGTWHAGPYFAEAERNFFNLELADTNLADYTTSRLAEPVSFAV
ncbi:MAG: ureidoglycolate lyase [Alphaproteobacteria bacterium]|nr:ureidoglycolate lyase [Alphaproteobacteria bacterium]